MWKVVLAISITKFWLQYTNKFVDLDNALDKELRAYEVTKGLGR